MEYREDFETRKDVFRVNVFYNKKNGEKVTMYFVPRTTPVNDDTVFDYCTKNKTWREKQAQQWCDEKSGKNKDKLKSLPFVAGGLQRDLRWLGDNAKALFDEYKRGLGMTVQTKMNGEGSNSDIEALSKLPQDEIVGKFQTRFGISKKDWEQKVTPVGGSSIVSVTLHHKGKQYSGKGSDKRGAQYVAILDFLEKEYGIKTKSEIEARKDEAAKRAAEARQAELLDKMKYLRVLSERHDVVIEPTSWINLERPAKGPRVPANNFMVETPYGKQELTSSEISLAMIKGVTVTAAEREEYNQRIEKDRKELITKIEYKKEQERLYEVKESQRIADEKRMAEEKVKAKVERGQENGELNAQLEEAVKADDLEKVKSLVAAGAQISNAWDKEEDFENTLLLALDNVPINQDMVNFLIDNGAKTEFENYDYDGDLSHTTSLLCSKITNLEVDAVRALAVGGANIWFESRGYDKGDSVDDAIAEIKEEYNEEWLPEYADAVEIQKIIEDAREGRLEIHEANKAAQQNQVISTTSDVLSATETNSEIEKNVTKGAALASAAKEEKYVGTPLPLVSDDKGMVHLAPRENIQSSAIFSANLYGDNETTLPVNVALISEKANLRPNTQLSQEEMLINADEMSDCVLLLTPQQALQIASAMEAKGDVKGAAQIRLKRNMWNKQSPIIKPYDNNIFTQLFARSGKGQGE